MSMPYVHLFEPVNASGKVKPTNTIPFSGHTKAESHCNREFNKPEFKQQATDVIVVSADERIVGWITKKLVQ